MAMERQLRSLLRIFNPPERKKDGDAAVGETLLKLCVHPDAWEALEEAFFTQLRAGDPALRAISLRGLAGISHAGGLEPSIAVDALEPFLDDESPDVRAAALFSLVWVDPLSWHPKLAARVQKLIASPATVDAELSPLLYHLGLSKEDSLIAPVREALAGVAHDAKAPPERMRAGRALAGLASGGDNASMRPLATLLDDPVVEVRLAALAALRAVDLPEATESITRALDDADDDVFSLALKVLRTRAGTSLSDRLRARWMSEKDPQRKARLRMALSASRRKDRRRGDD